MSDPFEILLEQLSSDDLLEQRRQYLEQADELRARADAIDKLIAIKERLSPTQIEPRVSRSINGAGRRETVTLEDLVREAERPGVAEAIQRVMHEDPDGTWAADRLLARMGELGWAPRGKTPRNSIAATLSRLRAMGEVERVGSGEYKLAAHKRQASRPDATGREEQQLNVEEGG